MLILSHLSKWNESSLSLSCATCFSFSLSSNLHCKHKILHISICKSYRHDICYEAAYQFTNLVFPLLLATLTSTKTCIFFDSLPSFSVLHLGAGFHLPLSSPCLQNKCIKFGLKYTKHVDTRKMQSCQATHLPTFHLLETRRAAS